jgi:DNA repair exonuclease SbcCD ATPase subunit
MKGNNDHLTNRFEQLSSLVGSLRKSNIENYELTEQVRAEKTALENANNSLQSELVNLKLPNEDLNSEREVKIQQLEELREELQESISERSGAEETRLHLEKILTEKNHLKKQLVHLLEEKKSLDEQLNDEENIRKESYR